MESNWPNLPKDILELISKKISLIEDYIRFRAVCVPWRSSLSPNPRHLPPQLPWLILPYDPCPKDDNRCSTRFFYDITKSKICCIDLPETCGKQYCGSSKGWMMLADGSEISLLNPITKARIQLPSLKNSPNILSTVSDTAPKLDSWSSWYSSEGIRDPIIQKTILSSELILDSTCIVMALFRNNWGLAFCRIGDESWTVLDEPARERWRWTDATYHNGLFYCLYYDEVRVYDFDGLKEVLEIVLPFDQVECHLLEGSTDDLLMMVQFLAPHGLSKRDEFSICKLEITREGEANWIEVLGIGEKICFMCTRKDQCFTFPIENIQFHGWGSGNLMCYAYPRTTKRVENRVHPWFDQEEDEFGYDIKMVKLPTEDISYTRSYWKENVTHLAKSVGSYPMNYTRASWVTPSFY